MAAEQTKPKTRVFISYSRVDSEFAFRLRADLEANGFATWMDPNLGSEGGQNWMQMIQEAIDSCQAMVVIVSPDSVKSQYVQIEYHYIQDQPGKLLIPLYYRTVDPFPIDLRLIQWLEFREDQSEQGTYQTGFASLLHSLAKVPSPPKLPPIPQTPGATAARSAISGEVDKPEYAKGAQPQQELSPEIRGLIAGVYIARNEKDLAKEEYFLGELVAKGTPQIQRTYAERLKIVTAQREEQRLASLRAQAAEAMGAKHWRKAIGAWQALLSAKPNDSQAVNGLRVARVERASEALRAGEYDEAIGIWQTLLRDAQTQGNHTTERKRSSKSPGSGTVESEQTNEAQKGLRAALHARAEDAWKHGDWARAAETWETLRSLTPSEAHAKEYLRAISQNQSSAHRYQIAQQLLAADNVGGAHEALEDVYKAAPHYGDPAGIAPKVGIQPPNAPVVKPTPPAPQPKPQPLPTPGSKPISYYYPPATPVNVSKPKSSSTDWSDLGTGCLSLFVVLATTFVIAPANLLGVVIAANTHIGIPGSMALTDGYTLSWMSALLFIALLFVCQIPAIVIGNWLDLGGGTRISIAVIAAFVLTIPGSWVTALWVYTGFQRGADWATFGILAVGGIFGISVVSLILIIVAGLISAFS